MNDLRLDLTYDDLNVHSFFFQFSFFFFLGHLAVKNSLCKSDKEGILFYGKDIKRAFITFFV